MSGAADMPARLRVVAMRMGITLLYLARPWSCARSLALELRPADNLYHSVDPHGFGLMFVMASALTLVMPVLWLLLQVRPAAAGRIGGQRAWKRSAAVILVIGTPMLMQLPYLRMPIDYGWPVVAVSGAWFALVAALCVYRGRRLPSVHGAFDRSPRAAWGVVVAIGLAKLFLVAFIITG